MFYLGLCYQRSEGVEKDLNEAFILYQQAADKGNSTAKAYLGLCYQYEIGVKQDLDKAISQYQRAVDEGNSMAMVFLGRCYQYGEGVNQNLHEAIALYQKATDKGDSTAMTCLALCYQDGKGVDQDWNKAINLYQQAVKKNDCIAMYYLGACYENGYGVKKNRDSAIELYQMAVNQGNSNAMVNLGFYYQNGIGVKQNRKEAVKLFQRAAKVGDFRAMYNLGVCYENGEGVYQDWNKAISLYQQTTKAGEIRAISNIQNILLRNFLGEGNYKSRKTNGCTRNKLSHLVEKLAFDPPILGGDWKPLLTEEIKACIDKVIVPFEILELSEILDNYTGQSARLLPLVFYQDCSLVDIQLYNPSNNNKLIFSAIFNDEYALLLNGKSDTLYSLNRHVLSLDESKSAINYLRFFCSYVQSEYGPFQLITHLDEIPFKDEGMDQNIRDTIKASIHNPEYLEGSFERDGWQAFKACVLYGGALFSSVMRVFSNGRVSLEEDRAIADNLLLLQRQYHGIFRTPL